MGQFNSYWLSMINANLGCLLNVSIPSNGSIQFLRKGNWEDNRTVSFVSIPSNGSIQFLHKDVLFLFTRFTRLSQSPQTGQFNSYAENQRIEFRKLHKVSIPSNGSIQFLRLFNFGQFYWFWGLNPLKRVNSILTWSFSGIYLYSTEVSIPSNGSIQFLPISRGFGVPIEVLGLNPLKRVNSILTYYNLIVKN